MRAWKFFQHNCSYCKKQQTTIVRACWKWFNMPWWSPNYELMAIDIDAIEYCDWLVCNNWQVQSICWCALSKIVSLCCSSVSFYFDSERLLRKWSPPGKKTNDGKSCTAPPKVTLREVTNISDYHFSHLTSNFVKMNTGNIQLTFGKHWFAYNAVCWTSHIPLVLASFVTECDMVGYSRICNPHVTAFQHGHECHCDFGP